MMKSVIARERTEDLVRQLFGVSIPRGHTGETRSCPLARVFDNNMEITHVTIDKMPLTKSAKAAFKAFISYFDEGKYPDLVIQRRHK